MLTQLTIHNFAIVERLELEFGQGMTVISGETGAGKSIMLDALGLALGDRAESGSVRQGAERADITASFDIRHLPQAQQWLQEQELEQDGDCLLRRTLSKEGRSRAYINGHPCSLQALRTLGEHLIEIHGQHEHQRLLKKENHAELLDTYAGLKEPRNQVEQLCKAWQQVDKRLKNALLQSSEADARRQLLTYQVEELEQLSLAPGESDELESEQRRLSQAQSLLASGDQLLQLTSEDEQQNCVALLNQCLHLLDDMPDQHPSLDNAREMLNSALIQVDEASDELRRYLDRVEINPERLQEVDERLGSAYQLARKHHTTADHLPTLHQELSDELANLTLSNADIEALEAEREQLQHAYQRAAQELSQARRKAAQALSQRIDEQLHRLGMNASHFETSLTQRERSTPQPGGLEEVEFLISTNKGQPAKPLNKIASGGELSRISLAIQVITAQSSTTPSLVFDEVDVGIGGAVAEVVGRLLRELGNRTQILCVTHQPQVASQGHQHLFVSKREHQQQTHTQIEALDDTQRIEEIARMLGGIEITQRSRDHAREMLALA